MILKLFVALIIIGLLVVFGPHLFLKYVQNVHDFDSCERAGYQVTNLFCPSCSNRCDTPFGISYFQKNGDVSQSDAIKFNGLKIWQDSKFKFNPINSCVGDNSATLKSIDKDSITIEITEQESFNGKYFPVTPARKEIIQNGTCLSAIPLCTDVFYSYCFTIDNSGDIPNYVYKIVGESTMPAPAE